MLNTYIIITPASPTELENLMIQYLPPNNNFLFFDVTDQDYGGWLPKAAWDWIKQYTR